MSELYNFEPPFEPFKKIPRLSRRIIISEKIDGTNGCVGVFRMLPSVETPMAIHRLRLGDNFYAIYAGSRSRWLLPGKATDNYGFAEWVQQNAEELVIRLGEGRHFGEYYGRGINRGYGLDHRRFALFNISRWTDPEREGPPECCSVVPLLYDGNFSLIMIEGALCDLEEKGSVAVPGFMQPEGIIVFHVAASILFKKTIVDDQSPKMAEAA